MKALERLLIVLCTCLLTILAQQHDRKELLACCLLGRGLTSQPCPNDACKWICGTDGCTVEKLIKNNPANTTPTSSFSASPTFNRFNGAQYARTIPQRLPGFTTFSQPTATAFSVPDVRQWGYPKTSVYQQKYRIANPAPVVTAAPAVDKHQYCCFWAKQNKCDTPDTKSFMDVTCPISCKTPTCNQKIAAEVSLPQQSASGIESQDFSNGATEQQLKEYRELQLTRYAESVKKSLDADQQQQIDIAQSSPQRFSFPQGGQPAYNFPQSASPVQLPAEHQGPSLPSVGQSSFKADYPAPQPELADSQLKQFCCYWASQKQCQENPAWMLVQCKEECEDPSCSNTETNPLGFDPTGKNAAKQYAEVKKAQDAATSYTDALNKGNEERRTASVEAYIEAHQKANNNQNAYYLNQAQASSQNQVQSQQTAAYSQNLQYQQQLADYYKQNPQIAQQQGFANQPTLTPEQQQQQQQQYAEYYQQNPLTPQQQSVLNQRALTQEEQQQQLSPEQNAALYQQQSYIEKLQKEAQAQLALAQSDPAAFAAQYRANHPETGVAAGAAAQPEAPRPVAGPELPPASNAATAGALTASQQYYYPTQYQAQPQVYPEAPQQVQYNPYIKKNKTKKAK